MSEATWQPKIGDPVRMTAACPDAILWNAQEWFVAGVQRHRVGDRYTSALDVFVSATWPEITDPTDGFLINRPDGPDQIEPLPTATRSAPKADGLVEELREKADQVTAAKRNLHGLPILVTESDTQPGRSALWMDNGLAGCGQVAVSTGEFPCRQTDAVAALANVAASLDFQRILAALKDRDVVLEEAAAGPWRKIGEFEIDPDARYLVQGTLRMSIKFGREIERDHVAAALIQPLAE